MARAARKLGSSGIYHVMLRGNNRLFGSDSDIEYFRTLADKYLSDKCMGLRILENKVHIIIKEENAPLSDVVKPLCTSYARYCNRTRGGNGKLFRGRYKSEPLETEDELLSALKYIYRASYDEYKRDELIKNKFSRKKIENAAAVLGMDDYESMSDAELLSVIEYVCGGDFDKLGASEKAAVFHEKDIGKRVRIGLVLKALDVPKAENKKETSKAKKKAPKPRAVKAESKKKTPKADSKKKASKQKAPQTEIKEEPQKQEKKKELSVWLL